MTDLDEIERIWTSNEISKAGCAKELYAKARELAQRQGELQAKFPPSLCSIHRDRKIDCDICYVDINSLLQAHVEAHDETRRNLQTAEQRVSDLEQKLGEAGKEIFDNLPYLENLINIYGHESGLLSEHPSPCNDHDFCFMRQAKKGSDAIRAALNAAIQERKG